MNVSAPGGTPSSVEFKVFDAHGLIGHSVVTPAPVPGTLTIRGFAAAPKEVRVVADGGAMMRGAVRVTVQPHQVTTTMLVLENLRDDDGDGVPDAVDVCPTVPDPNQESAAGGAPGDACSGGAPPDLANAAVADLAGSAAADLAGSAPDLAGSDLATAAPDMAVGASLCATAGLLLCDGFESTTISSAWIQNVSGGGSVALDSTRAYRGTRSLRSHNEAVAAGGLPQANLLETSTFAVGKAPTHFFVRAFLYVPSGFAIQPAGVFLAGQTVPPYDAVTVQLNNGGLSSFSNLVTPNIVKGPAGTVPNDKWTCLEWEIDVNAGVVNVWLDGAASTALSGSQNLTNATPIGELGFGLVTSAATAIGARDVWLDEIAVDGARITCAR